MPIEALHAAVRRAAIAGVGLMSLAAGLAIVHLYASPAVIQRVPTASLLLVPVLLIGPGATYLARRAEVRHRVLPAVRTVPGQQSAVSLEPAAIDDPDHADRDRSNAAVVAQIGPGDRDIQVPGASPVRCAHSVRAG